MKKSLACVFICSLLVLAFSPAVFADNAPSQDVVIPEAIWAPATGGGTWVTALQIHSATAGAPIYLQYFYGTAHRGITLTTTTAARQTFRYTNILQTMGTIDTAFNYSGTVGTLLIFTSTGNTLWAQAMTTNGNYGKTMPSLVWQSSANTAVVGRDMTIPGIMHTTAYRTGAGFWNSTSAAMTVRFYIMSSSGWVHLGNYFEKIIPAFSFIAFNPFTEASLPVSAALTNNWLYINPRSGGGPGEGLFCYGSIANNTSNDTCTLTAIPFL